MMSITDSCDLVEKNQRFTVGKSERKGAMVASPACETRRKGGIGPICLVLNKARRRHFIANTIHTGQVVYGTTGELKGEIESTNRARE